MVTYLKNIVDASGNATTARSDFVPQIVKNIIDISSLRSFEGKSISDICDIGYHKFNDNHCAHFVSHVMGYNFGAVTCANLTLMLKQEAKKLNKKGATLRVDDVFKKCREVGKWEDKKPTVTACLVFIINKKNVNLKKKTMSNVPRKHIGIYCNNKIWHYSNSKNKVISQTAAEFKKHYGSSSAALKTYQIYCGTFPL